MKEEARGKMEDARTRDRQVSNSELSAQRRKLLGWMGISIVGAIAVKALPFKSFSRRLVTRRRRGASKAQVAINEMAVKRTRKVSRNG